MKTAKGSWLVPIQDAPDQCSRVPIQVAPIPHVGLECKLPQAVTDHGHRMRACRAFFFGEECPAQRCADAEDSEVVAGDQGRLDTARIASAPYIQHGRVVGH